MKKLDLVAVVCTFVFVVMAAGANAARADESADPVKARLADSPRHHEWAEIKTATGRTVKAYVVFPEVDRKVPAIVVIHENRGLNDWARSLADQVAEAGYIAVAPDLLSGQGADKGGTSSFASEDDARTALYELPPDQVLSDLDATVAYAKKIDAANGKVAVCGFCWGGGQTFRFATHNSDILAAYVFYGPAPDGEDALKKIECPVYGFYGGNDARITGQVPRVTERMKAAGKKYEPVVYEGAGHGFLRSGEAPDADAANRKGREEAWARWKELLKKL